MKRIFVPTIICVEQRCTAMPMSVECDSVVLEALLHCFAQKFRSRMARAAQTDPKKAA